MLKLLRLCAFTALLLCYSGSSMADSETFRVKFMGTPVPSTIPFGTENVKLLFGNTYVETEKNAGTGIETAKDTDWKNYYRDTDGDGTGDTYTVNCGNNAVLANGNSPKGQIPAKGCYYQITPLKDGTMTVRLATNASNKGFYIISTDDNVSCSLVSDAVCSTSMNTTLEYTNGTYVFPSDLKHYIIVSCNFNVNAGKTYYIYGAGTKVGFTGYDFCQYGETETFAFTKTDDPDKYVGTTKTFENTNVTLTLGTSGETVIANQWYWNEKLGYIVYSSKDDAKSTNGIPTFGCYNKITAKNNGKLIVRLITNIKPTGNDKSFRIVNEYGSSTMAVCTSDGIQLEKDGDAFKLPKDTDWKLTLCEFNVEAGKSYYVYGNGTKLGFAGYDFIPEGNKESLTVGADQKPGKVYQTMTRDEERNAQDQYKDVAGEWTSTRTDTPALYIALGNGTWQAPVTIESTKKLKEDGTNKKNFDEKGKYILNSHFEWEIIPDAKSNPTDGRQETYVFDGNENKSLPVTGAFYTVTAMKSGTIYLYFDKSDKTKFGMLWITDSKGNSVERYPNGIYNSIYDGTGKDKVNINGGIDLVNKTQSFMFHATAGTTYYIFNSAKEWDANIYNDPARIGLAGVIFSDGITDIKNEFHYNIKNGNVHEVGDQIKTPGMVMTFGGQDKKNNIYTEAKQDNVFQAYPVGDNQPELYLGYSTAGDKNPVDELGHDKNQKFKPNVNTHSLPFYGTYYKFEPQCSGELTVHVLQNGALDLDETGEPNEEVVKDKTLRVRPLYIADEKGNTINAKEVKINGKLKFEHNGKYDFTSYTNYDLYKDQWEKASVNNNFEISKSGDGGYVLINKAYCKYIFDVKPGKTYFVFTNASKLGFCGHKFIPNENNMATSVTLQDESTTEPLFTKDTDVTITYNRSFKADTWMPVTLPYSMTETQVKNTFGEGTMVIYFDGIEGNTIKFKKHGYQMIVAGRPCFVKPTKSGTEFGPVSETDEAHSITINNAVMNFNSGLAYVTIDGETIEPAVNGEATGTLNGKFNFTLNASYAKQEKALKPNDYYFGGDGKIYRTQEGENWDIKGYRSFLKCSDNTSGAKAILAGADFGEDSSTTAIDNVEADNGSVISAKAVVYDLNGRVVKTSTEGLKDLVKGVYIVDGKKVIIK